MAARLAAEADPHIEGIDGDHEESPYVGLAAFQPEDADRFFGRDRVVDELVARLAQRRFLGVFGPSGSGKSSLLRAGLLHRLRNGEARSQVVLFTPGPRPLEECAVQLAALTGASAAQLYTEFRAEPRNLHLAIRQALVAAAEDELIVIIDQFEEVFTLCTDHEERRGFLDAVLTAATADGARCRVVVGVRADFYGHCALHPALVAALTDGQVLVGPMTAGELRDAIVQPAVRSGYSVEGELVAQLVAEAEGQTGVLPPLSHALRETWRRRSGNRLALSGYQATGGIAGALTRTADECYEAMDAGQRQATRRLFLRLTAVGDGTEDTKRRITRDELDTADPELELVLERLAAARLLTLDDDRIEVSHEALIRAWPRLRGWLAEDREGLRLHRLLTEAAATWASLDRDPGALYRGTRLAVAREWTAAHTATLSRREQEFLDASVAAQQREQAVTRRRARRLRQLVALLTVLFLVAATTTVLAVRAEDATTDQRNIALSQKVAGQTTSLRAGNPGLAAQLSLAAYRLAPTVEARSAVLTAFSSPYATLLTGHAAHLEAVAYSPDGHLLATTSQDHTARLWDVTSPHRPKSLATLTGHADAVYAAAFSPDNHLLATAGRDRTARLWDVTVPQRPAPRATLTHSATVHAVAFSPDGRQLATGSADGAVRLWDLADPGHPALLAELTRHGDLARSLAFSPDGRTLATASDDHTARLWDVTAPGRPQLLATLLGHTDAVTAVAISPDGHLLATSSADRTVRVWTIADPRRPSLTATISGRTDIARSAELSPDGRNDIIRSVAFSPDGRSLATASQDHTARIFDVTDPGRPQPVVTLSGHTDFVDTLAFSPDGRNLATGSDDRTVRIWDIPGPVLTGHTDFVFGAAYRPDGRVLATTSQDHTVRLWDVTDPQRPRQLSVLSGHTDYVTAVAFSPDGRTVATSSGDNTVRLWNVADPGKPAGQAVLAGLKGSAVGVAFSPDGRLLATAGDDNTARLWDLSDPGDPTAIAVLRGHTGAVRSVAFSPDGHFLATAGDDNTARLWTVENPRRPKEAAIAAGHRDSVRSAVFSPDGRLLLTASNDTTSRLWDVTDPQKIRQVAVLAGHADGVMSAVFDPSGHRVATASIDHTARLWDVTTPETPALTAILTGHTDRIHHVAFSPDGRTLVTTSRDKTARLWDTDVAQNTTRICGAADHPPSRDEWHQYFPDTDYAPPCPTHE